jgi:hypothetical protein
MKKILRWTLINVFTAVALLALMPGCASTGSDTTAVDKPVKEKLLAQAGFGTRNVTTPEQQKQVSELAENKVTAVKYNGKLYYVYPTGKKDQIFVGRQAQFDAYKQALQQLRASQQAQQSEQMLHGSPVWVGETAGPDHIGVEVFRGFPGIGDPYGGG